MDVRIRGSEHKLPPAAQVPTLVSDLVAKLNAERESVPALDRAGYALWRINWIHPFAGGNGRTARAVSYSVICIDIGVVPPGTRQFPAVIYDKRDAYVEALKRADASELTTGTPDLADVRQIIEDALLRQLAGVIDSLGKPPSIS
jgi:Fic family protein